MAVSKGDEVIIEIGENEEDDGGVAKEDFRWFRLLLPPWGVNTRMLDPPPGCDCCLHFRMDLWLFGVVLEQLVSQSSKAESLPSVMEIPLLSTSCRINVDLVSTSEDEAAAAAAAAAARAACCSCTILEEGSWRCGGVGVSANFQMYSHKSDAVH